jgi:hypothetical protein
VLQFVVVLCRFKLPEMTRTLFRKYIKKNKLLKEEYLSDHWSDFPQI